MTEAELKAAQEAIEAEKAALQAEKDALEAKKKELEERDETELEAKLKNHETTIQALQAKLKEKKPAKENPFDAEAFKAELAQQMANTVAEQVKAGIESAQAAKEVESLVSKIKEIDKDFKPEGFDKTTLTTLYNTLTKQQKVNQDTPNPNASSLFQPYSPTGKDPSLEGVLKLRAEAKKAKEGK